MTINLIAKNIEEKSIKYIEMNEFILYYTVVLARKTDT